MGAPNHPLGKVRGDPCYPNFVDIDALRSSPVGQLVPISGHDDRQREFSYWAFLPMRLPDEVSLTASTWNCVVAASTALGRLHQACLSLPDPRLLIAPALAREAVDTSALEGTFGALADVLEARLSDARPTSPAVAEITAYERLAHRAFDWVKDRPITVGLLEDLQGILAADSTSKQIDPGRVRQHQVVIGPRGSTIYESRFVPPPPDDRLRSGLQEWQDWIDADHDLPAVVTAAMSHYQFETLHPFGDGNGRIGRLVVLLHLMRRQALAEPALTISAWLRKRRDEYQDHLLAVSMTGDWNPWVEFFSHALRDQAESAVRVVDELNSWLSDTRREVNDRHWSGTVLSIVEDLVKWPVITSTFVQSNYGVSAPTAKSAIDRLQEMGALEELTGGKYRRVYGATAVMKAVESL